MLFSHRLQIRRNKYFGKLHELLLIGIIIAFWWGLYRHLTSDEPAHTNYPNLLKKKDEFDKKTSGFVPFLLDLPQMEKLKQNFGLKGKEVKVDGEDSGG